LVYTITTSLCVSKTNNLNLRKKSVAGKYETKGRVYRFRETGKAQNQPEGLFSV
jgi:hypothetical protein